MASEVLISVVVPVYRAQECLEELHRRVCAVRDDRARVEQFAPNIRTLARALLAEAGENIGSIGGAMYSLHRGNHAQFAEPRDILRAQMLRMFDAPAQVLLFGMLLERALKEIEHFTIATVANGVDAELKSILNRPFRRLFHVRNRFGAHAAAFRQIGVRLQ